MRHGSGSGRGRHKNAGSPETRRWKNLEGALQGDAWKPEPKRKRERPGPPPARPPWLDPDEYRALIELRRNL